MINVSKVKNLILEKKNSSLKMIDISVDKTINWDDIKNKEIYNLPRLTIQKLLSSSKQIEAPATYIKHKGRD